MLRTLGALTAINAVLLSTGIAFGQIQFERITTGSPATDVNTSFGCSWADYDDDGWVDLFVGNGFGQSNCLYHNNGDGTFTKVTDGPIPNDGGDSGSGIWVDFDNDGDLDLFVGNYDPPSTDFLYRNDGNGVFVRVLEGDAPNNALRTAAASCADYDNDGWLDLFEAAPHDRDLLYRNIGTGELERITGVPPANLLTTAISGTWADYDNDGDLDLYVANATDTGQKNTMFRNEGAGQWTQIVEGPHVNDVAASQSPIWGDYDNDGDLDLFLSNWSGHDNRLYQNQGDGSFTAITEGSLVTTGGNSQGAVWGDFDNDGYLDVLVANAMNEPNQVFHNQRDGSFSLVQGDPLPAVDSGSAACAVADYDNDGYLDVYVANNGSTDNGWSPEGNFLYHNSGSGNSWLSVRLIGTVSNRSGVGAKLRLRASVWGKQLWLLRQVSAGEGYYIQNDLRVHFGLGNATKIDAVRIEWPSGTVQELENLEPNQILAVYEPPRLTAEGPGEIRVGSWVNQVVKVEASSDLQSWSYVGASGAVAGVVVHDEGAQTSDYRYYRAAMSFGGGR